MVNWWMAGLGALIAAVIWLVLSKAGFVRWWKRRRAWLQLVLMVLLPAWMIAITIAISFLLTININDLAGLLFGIGLVTMLFLVATSYLIDQIRQAFSASDTNEHHE